MASAIPGTSYWHHKAKIEPVGLPLEQHPKGREARQVAHANDSAHEVIARTHAHKSDNSTDLKLQEHPQCQQGY